MLWALTPWLCGFSVACMRNKDDAKKTRNLAFFTLMLVSKSQKKQSLFLSPFNWDFFLAFVGKIVILRGPQLFSLRSIIWALASKKTGMQPELLRPMCKNSVSTHTPWCKRNCQSVIEHDKSFTLCIKIIHTRVHIRTDINFYFCQTIKQESSSFSSLMEIAISKPSERDVNLVRYLWH